MARRAVPLVFPIWRDLWAPLDGVPELLTAADAALRRRMNGNRQVPRWTISGKDGERLAIAVRASQAWSEDEPPRDWAARPRVIRQIHAVLSPALRAVAWPRWLLLERAYLDASATGDLLFAVLLSRPLPKAVRQLGSAEQACNHNEHIPKADADQASLAD